MKSLLSLPHWDILTIRGITAASDMNRLTTRLRADYQAKKWLKVGGNVSYAKFDHNALSNNGSKYTK